MTYPLTRDDALAALDDYAAVGDHPACTRAARDLEQQAATARATELPQAGWLARLARAYELRAAGIDYRLEGRIADALDCEAASEEALGRGPHDVLSPREIDHLVDTGMSAFWAAIEEDECGQWLVEDDGDGPDINDTDLRTAARQLFRKLAYRLAEESNR